MAELPMKVAIIRCRVRGHVVTILNDCLSRDQRAAACIAASILGASKAYVMLTREDVVAAINAVINN